MDGKLFLGTARFLKNEGKDEAAFRSAISRAYYACFIVLRDKVFLLCDKKYLKRESIKKGQDITHKKLRQYLKNGNLESVEKLGEGLSSLHGNRLDADYNMEQFITDRDAQNAIEEAELILNMLKDISEEEIKAALSNYFKTIYRY